MSTVVMCDGCRIVIKPPAAVTNLTIGNIKHASRNADLCPECLVKVNSALKRVIAEVPQLPPKEKNYGEE